MLIPGFSHHVRRFQVPAPTTPQRQVPAPTTPCHLLTAPTTPWHLLTAPTTSTAPAEAMEPEEPEEEVAEQTMEPDQPKEDQDEELVGEQDAEPAELAEEQVAEPAEPEELVGEQDQDEEPTVPRRSFYRPVPVWRRLALPKPEAMAAAELEAAAPSELEAAAEAELEAMTAAEMKAELEDLFRARRFAEELLPAGPRAMLQFRREGGSYGQCLWCSYRADDPGDGLWCCGCCRIRWANHEAGLSLSGLKRHGALCKRIAFVAPH